MILFHGSNVPIEIIDLSKSRPGKDFGRGFYLSEDKEHRIKYLKGITFQYFFGTEAAIKTLHKL